MSKIGTRQVLGNQCFDNPLNHNIDIYVAGPARKSESCGAGHGLSPRFDSAYNYINIYAAGPASRSEKN